jgi:predicted metal-dependent HD superfamily phosphohydrolase
VTEPTLDRWRDLLAAVGATADATAVTAVGERLLARWREPHRAYHTVDHLSDVLDRVAELGIDEEPRAVGVAQLAAWWHDAVYDPSATDNEDRSAGLAATELAALRVDDATVAEVARLVRLTATHDADPADTAATLLCDADLAILGSDPDRYSAYAADVRREYAAVPDAAFRAGRAAVLTRLLARERLFVTARGRTRFEAAARRNVAAEIDALSRRATTPDPTSGGAARPRPAG